MTIQELLDILNAIPAHRRAMPIDVGVRGTTLHADIVSTSWNAELGMRGPADYFELQIEPALDWLDQGAVHSYGRTP